MPSRPPHPDAPFNLRRYLKAYLVILTTAVIMEVLLYAVTHNPARMIVWFAAVAMYGVVTYGWTRGTQHSPPRAATTGTISGATVGAVVQGVVGLVGLVFRIATLFPESRNPGVANMLGRMVGGAIAMGIRGFAGGKAIDVGGRIPVGFRVMLGVGVAVGLQGIVGAAMGAPPGWWDKLLETFGWGVGLLMYPSSDPVLTAPGSAASRDIERTDRPDP
jgi:hypothetical protein